MSKHLAVVTKAPELSPARQRLADAIARRQACNEAVEQVACQHQRIEAKIAAGPALRAKIDALQAEHTALIEKWMLAGEDTRHPALPHAVEIAELVAELERAVSLENGAKAALARLNEQLTGHQRDAANAIEGIKSAADAVLVETAAAMAKELETVELRAGLLRGQLMALRRHFELEQMRHRPVAEPAGAVARMIPRGPYEMAPQSIEVATNKWSDLASQLFTNVTAEMEQTR
jgi:hypothetical protein